tara:strand:+ start:381 stop:1781 length:1401 start_codon:yes stop_codon:yes gene_type:complete
MKSKDFIKQVKLDNLTLMELHKLDNLNIEKFSKFGEINLLSLVIVQLQAYLSSSIINAKKKPYNNLNFFPFANSKYLENNLNFKTTQADKNWKWSLQRLKKIIYTHIPFSNISTLNAFSHIYRDLEQVLNKNFIVRKTATFKPMCLCAYDEQYKILKDYLDVFKYKNQIKNINYSENFINYIKPYFSKERFKIDRSDFLLVGTNSKLENRVTSANYLINKRQVISFNHANYNTLIIDEPHQEYAEHAFCNYYVDYGSINKQIKTFKSNFLFPKKIIHLNNSKMNKITLSKNIKKEIIYVPDCFNGDRRQGPYREMDDKKYYVFQKKLLHSKKNILLKTHPKTDKAYANNFKHDKKIILSENLSYLISDYKLFIVDRISQAFFTIACSDTKILYFNLGRRRIKKEILNEIKKRAYVVNIDPYNIDKKKIAFYINKAENFKIKKNKVLALSSHSKNKNFNEILNLIRK